MEAIRKETRSITVLHCSEHLLHLDISRSNIYVHQRKNLFKTSLKSKNGRSKPLSGFELHIHWRNWIGHGPD